MTHRVAVIGDALIDIVDGRWIPGGAALNVAVGLARLGATVDLVTMLAHDEPGQLLRSYAAERGVTVHATSAPLGTATATATRVDNSMRYVFNEAGIRRRFEVGEYAEVLEAADGIVVSCVPLEHSDQTDALLALQHLEVPFVLDANPRPGYLGGSEATVRAFAAGLDRLAAGATMVKLSDEDTQLLFGEEQNETAERMLAAGLDVALITTGPEGASIRTGTRAVHRPIVQLPEPIVDTIGAGDATTAAMTLALLEGGTDTDWGSALEHAMRIAAATCRVAGGELQLP